MPTLKQISKDLNVSISIVSRILNGKAKEFRISDATVDIVLKHAKKIGYAPNLIAKGLQASQTFTLGLMVPNIANSFFAVMAKNIEKWAFKASYSIILVDSDESVEIEKQQVNNMLGRKVDGIIIAPVGDSYQHFSKIVKQRIPLIFVDRYFTESSIPYITSNNYQGCYDATKHLIKKGHSRIGLICGNNINELVQERTKGYLDAHKDSGVPIFQELTIGNTFSIENGFDSTNKLLQLDQPPTSILAMNNLIGFGVLQAIHKRNLSIPSQLSLIIFDDHPYLSLLSPSISAIKQDSEKIGEMAVKAILKEINSESDIQSIQIPTKLILRDSVFKLNA